MAVIPAAPMRKRALNHEVKAVAAEIYVRVLSLNKYAQGIDAHADARFARKCVDAAEKFFEGVSQWESEESR